MNDDTPPHPTATVDASELVAEAGRFLKAYQNRRPATASNVREWTRDDLIGGVVELEQMLAAAAQMTANQLAVVQAVMNQLAEVQRAMAAARHPTPN